MLPSSIWERVNPPEQSPSYLVFVPEMSCVISSVFVDSSKQGSHFSYGAWYEEVDRNELRIALCRRLAPVWKPVIYREYGDTLKWIVPQKDGSKNEFEYERIGVEELPSEARSSVERAKEKIQLIMDEQAEQSVPPKSDRAGG